jgi:hypothetical protein
MKPVEISSAGEGRIGKLIMGTRRMTRPAKVGSLFHYQYQYLTTTLPAEN